MASTMGRFREFLKKYGKVGLGVHFTVSAASISGLYIAIRNNVDVESILHKVGIGGSLDNDQHDIKLISNDHTQPQHDIELISDDNNISQKKKNRTTELAASSGGALAPTRHDIELISDDNNISQKKKNRTTELAASSGGALALAVLCNKALFPIRFPITLALTRPVARFLARRKIT